MSSRNIGLFFVHYCKGGNRTERSLGGALTALTAFKDHSMTHDLPWLSSTDEWHVKRIRRGLRKLDRSAPKRKQPMTYARLAELSALSDLSCPRDCQYLTMSYVAHDR